jgi:hypothetical protein
MRRQFLFVIVLGLAACAPTGEEARGVLEQTVTAFQNGLRWQRCDQTAAMLDQPLRARFADTCEGLSGRLGIEDMRVLQVNLDEAAGTAEVEVRITYYLLPDNTLGKATAHLSWKRVGEVWLLQKAEGAFFPELLPRHRTGAGGSSP